MKLTALKELAMRFTLLALFTLGAAPLAQNADLVLWNGTLHPMTESEERFEALAVAGDRVMRLGTRAEIEALVGTETKVIDLAGRCAMPGFIDAHAHFLRIGQMRTIVDLRDASSWEECVERVRLAAQEIPAGTPILGRGWHQEKWSSVPAGAIEGLPRHESLSAVTPKHPVVLSHASGHATFANALAMRMSRVDSDTEDPPGGELVRDEHGEPIGVFRERAMELLIRATSGAKRPDKARLARLAAEECLSKGITGLHDAGISFDELHTYRDLARQGELDIRLWVLLNEPNAQLSARLSEFRERAWGDFLTLGGIKRSIDGALGSHGAWLLEPYADLPNSTGLNLVPLDDLRATAQIAATEGLQLCVHAIGDRANREVLDVYEATFDEHGNDDRRWRIEHAQHLHPDDIPRFANLGVIPSIQSVHCTSDGPWVPERIGPKRASQGAYRWRELLKTGARITNGTDAPVEDVDPLANFRAAVTRRMPNGEVFHADQCLTRVEALTAATRGAAFAAFQEERVGTLEAGRFADVAVLSSDPLTVPADELASLRVELTIVGGKVVFERAD